MDQCVMTTKSIFYSIYAEKLVYIYYYNTSVRCKSISLIKLTDSKEMFSLCSEKLKNWIWRNSKSDEICQMKMAISFNSVKYWKHFRQHSELSDRMKIVVFILFGKCPHNVYITPENGCRSRGVDRRWERRLRRNAFVFGNDVRRDIRKQLTFFSESS